MVRFVVLYNLYMKIVIGILLLLVIIVGGIALYSYIQDDRGVVCDGIGFECS